MNWVLLFTAIALEVAGTTSMKLSQGLTRPLYAVLMFVFYAASFSLLSIVLKTLNVSVAYAVWSGFGTTLIAVIGFMWFNEEITLLKAFFIGMIVVGVVGLNLTGSAHE